MIDAIRTVAVLGAGTMGNGIAHVFARCGYTVILRDVEEGFLTRAKDTIAKNLDREVKKEKSGRGGQNENSEPHFRRPPRIYLSWPAPISPSKPSQNAST